MKKQKGCMSYIPPLVFEEVREIKTEFDLESNAEAMRKMAKFSKLGRLNKNKGGFKLDLGF